MSVIAVTLSIGRYFPSTYKCFSPTFRGNSIPRNLFTFVFPLQLKVLEIELKSDQWCIEKGYRGWTHCSCCGPYNLFLDFSVFYKFLKFSVPPACPGVRITKLSYGLEYWPVYSCIIKEMSWDLVVDQTNSRIIYRFLLSWSKIWKNISWHY